MTIVRKKRKPGPDINTKMMGGEPVLNMPSGSALGAALTWFAYTITPDYKRKWVADFMKANGFSSQEVETISSKLKHLSSTLAAMARLLTNGSVLDPKYKTEISETIRAVLDKNVVDFDADGNPILKDRNPSVQERIDQAAQKYIHTVDMYVDAFICGEPFPENMANLLINQGMSGAHAHKVIAHVRPMLEELTLALDPKSEENEYYHGYTRKRMLVFVANLNQLVSDLQGLIAMKRVVRRPRKRKAASADKLVKRMNYMREFSELKIASLAPEKIVGAQQLWVYNTKTRRLGVYQAADAAGLSVKGSTLKNFTEESVDKKIRKPEVVVVGVFQGTKASARKSFEAVNAVERKMTGRINKDTILLRVF